MTELVFLVESADEGGFVARAAGASIFAEGDSLEELRQNIRQAVPCRLTHQCATARRPPTCEPRGDAVARHRPPFNWDHDADRPEDDRS